MGYREYAKDYRMDYVSVEGKRRPRAVRTYIGPWFRFRASAERIRSLKRLYLIGLLVLLALLLLPLLLDCGFTRLWYIQLPGVLRCIPMFFALSALWRLWTAKERVDREHSHLLAPRMTTAVFFLAGFSLVSVIGCVIALFRLTPAAADLVVCAAELLSCAGSFILFFSRKDLEMEEIPQDEP